MMADDALKRIGLYREIEQIFEGVPDGQRYIDWFRKCREFVHGTVLRANQTMEESVKMESAIRDAVHVLMNIVEDLEACLPEYEQEGGDEKP